jgi:hypothetical protein
MAQSAIAGEGSFLAHLRTVAPNPISHGNGSTAGCPPAPAMDLTPHKSDTCRRVSGNKSP